MENCPTIFQPVDVTYPSYRNLILNYNGKIYSRFIQNPRLGFHTVAYNDIPFQYANDHKKGGNISIYHECLSSYATYHDARPVA